MALDDPHAATTRSHAYQAATNARALLDVGLPTLQKTFDEIHRLAADGNSPTHALLQLMSNIGALLKLGGAIDKWENLERGRRSMAAGTREVPMKDYFKTVAACIDEVRAEQRPPANPFEPPSPDRV